MVETPQESPHENPEGPAGGPVVTARSAKRAVWSTLAFVLVIGGVVATFALLGTADRPPPMAGGPQHELRFSLKGELLGVETDPPVDPAAPAASAGFSTDLKAVEKRINTGCQACHGAPGQDLSTHACQRGGRCLPPTHPPKTECIKCHRMAPRSGPE
jgi:hypothetical protein